MNQRNGPIPALTRANRLSGKTVHLIGMVVLITVLMGFFLLPIHSTEAEDVEEATLFLPMVRSTFGLDISAVVSNLVSPSIVTGIVDPGDGRLFIATRDGRVQVASADGELQSDLVLDIRDIVLDNGNEAGLVGLAVHPDFATNGNLFVFYVEAEGTNYFTVVARYQVGPGGLADPDSEERLLRFGIPTLRHVGGSMQFGPNDGYLYLGVGDGGLAYDRTGNAQSSQTFMGKILRIDVDRGSPYTIPSGNPFVADPDSLGEIWAMGLRNPWRFSFDRETGDMYIGDVGENTWEEINFIPGDSQGGENFGWSCKEGPSKLNTDICEYDGTFIDPIYYYRRYACGAVIGGFVYRGSQLPEVNGQYIFADLCDGIIWSLTQTGDDTWQPYNWGNLGQRYTTFGERSDGEILLGAYNKTIYMLTRPGTGE
jgi:glucose/arabinose dehydrogenase